ncbi:MAG: isoprenylcysteine carboxylmethyltransferase family protein [Chloroflexi bacterium]|nr:isoprenylcysteine carboxylmethyltransferase family protein [Chloroflexota bacterium]
MSYEGIFRGILAATFVLLTIIRVYYARKAGRAGEKSSTGRANRGHMTLLRLLNSAAAVVTLVYLIAPRWLGWAALPMPIWLRWIGGVLGLITVLLFFWIHHALGENWSLSVDTKARHTLVTSGPYRWVRHPMYTAIFVWTLAFFLLSANWFVGIAWLALSVLAASRAGEEEEALIETFGAEYQDYMRRTPRFLPGLGRWGEGR